MKKRVAPALEVGLPSRRSGRGGCVLRRPAGRAVATPTTSQKVPHDLREHHPRPRLPGRARSAAARSARSSSTSAGASTPASTSPATRPPTRTASAATSSSSTRELGVTHRALPRRQLRLRLPLGGRRRPARRSARAGSTWPGTRPSRTRSALDEFMRWSDAAGVEPMMAVNLGTRGRAGGARPARVLQRPRRHAPVRPAPRERRRATRTTSGCGAWATRWTARGRSATRPPTSTGGSRPRPRGPCA